MQVRKMKKQLFMMCLILITFVFPTKISAELMNRDTCTDTYLSDEIVQICETAEEVYGIDEELLEALIETESSGKQYAKNKAGDCIGICQLNPKYMKEFVKNVIGNDSFDWYDIEIQIYTCCEYINYLKDLDATEGDIYMVLQAYNEGPENVTGQSKYAEKITKRAFEITQAREQKK